MRESLNRGSKLLVNSPALAHYDPTKPITLACGVSPYGIGAVNSHVETNCQERPMAFGSHSLTKSERRYAQIKKDALAIIFSLQISSVPPWSGMFALQTDHKPSITILESKTGILTLEAACMQRWALILSAYQYKTEY